MNDKVKKRYVVLSVSITVILISIAFKVSYAFFTPTIQGNENVTETRAVTGKLDINFTTSDYINNSRLFLIKDNERALKAEKTLFTVDNQNSTGTLPATYQLYLTNVSISNRLKSADFKWELLLNNVVESSGNFSSATTGTDILITPNVKSIAVNQIDSWEFRIWLSETSADQSSLVGTDPTDLSSFSAKVSLVAQAGR